MFKQIALGACILSISSMALAQDNSIGISKNLYTEQGCSHAYYKRAKKVNRIMGVTIGATSIAFSTVMPLGLIFTLGGIGAIGESAFDLGHEKFNKQFQQNFHVKSVIEKKPLIRYPMARQFFDSLNTLEFAKALKNNTSDTAEYIKIYIRAGALSTLLKEQYKTCKSNARLSGISRSELKEIEKNLLEYLMQMEDENQSLNEISKGKQDFANCLLELKLNNKEDSYPIADMLLAQYELKDSGLLDWRLKGVLRQYIYMFKKAKEENKDIQIDQYFSRISKLDTEKILCKNEKKPLNRKKFTQEILSSAAQ